MSKREVHVLQGMVEAILQDYLTVYPSDAKEVERDIQRLSLAAQTRGLATFLLDLPALGKHFDRCLSDGSLSSSGLPLGACRWRDSTMPRLFSGLLMKVFERDSGCLRSDVDVTVIVFLRQLYYFAKGFNYDCSRKRTRDAVSEFYAVEREIRPSSLNWADDRIDLSRLRDLRICVDPGDEGHVEQLGFPSAQQSCEPDAFCSNLELVSDIVTSGFGIFSAGDWRTKHGPGAVSDLGSGVTKFSFPTWSEKLDRVFPYADHAFIAWDDWVDNVDHPASDSEAPSKLLTVPKTAKGPRLIASEPTSHQWCQQAILQFLLSGIQKTALRNSISLRDQEPSRRLVLEASRTRNYATIDLSAASDRVSCWLVERIFRANSSLVDAFHAVRSRYIKNGTKIKLDEPELLVLQKFTTMGSACTFPVQSIVFTLICIATILTEEKRRVNGRNIRAVSRQVRVFGDDIIIPTRHYDAVTRNLSVLGLKVNQSKSFVKGNFRESCGMDAWGGFDVTPAHLNAISDASRPSSVMAVLDASNNFFLKGFWHTATYIESTLPLWVRKNLAVVAHGCGMTGLKSFVGPQFHRAIRSRWNANLHRDEIRVVKLKSNTERVPQTGRHDLFQYFTDRPAPDTHWVPGRVRSSSEYLTLGWEPLSQFLN